MTAPTDTAKLADEVEALAKDATPGEWRQYRFDRNSELIVIDGENPQRVAASGRTPSDAALIVALVNSAPTIISALRELQAAKAREKEMREALEPFAKSAERDWDDDAPDDTEVWCSQGLGYSPTKSWFTVGDLRRARAAHGGEG